KVQHAVRILDQQRVDFEYDGEMAADVALSPDLMAAYPLCRLSGPANVLVMPAFHSAAISTKMLQTLGGATVIGPLLVGLDNSVQIVNLSSKDTDVVNIAELAAYHVSGSAADGEWRIANGQLDAAFFSIRHSLFAIRLVRKHQCLLPSSGAS